MASTSRRLSSCVLWAGISIGALVVGGCPPAEPTPVLDASVSDAPLDAAQCAAAEDCDDGVFCNGVEACAAGRCVAGSAPCNDGIACTTDYCSEDQRRCNHQAPDEDGDGHRSAACLDARGIPLGTDCDDADIRRFPGALEVCDAAGLDEDCDPTTLGTTDADRDGAISAACCNTQPDGALLCGTDCNDARSAVRPDAPEICDGIDNDCNGSIDEGLTTAGFVDADRDGYGDDARPTEACLGTPAFASVGGDCNDASPNQRPLQPEFCDGLDNDCDEVVDEDAAPVTWYRDGDGDGFGSSVTGVVSSCEVVPDATLLDNDCDDTDPTVSPGAAEFCDGRDTNCNGVADFTIAPGDTEDDDGDGIADMRCGAPFGLDCDDDDPTVGPGSAELCDTLDNDCDGLVDEGAVSSVFYADLDRDGIGSAASGTVVQCGSPGPGYSTRGGDCNDMDALRYPGASESCNGADDDCDAAVDEAPALAECGTIANASAACIGGACTIVACTAGRANCDGALDNGCEVALGTDPLNCGSCGTVCAGRLMCGGGVCAGSFLSPGMRTSSYTRPTSLTYQIDTLDETDVVFYTTDGSIPGASSTTTRAAPPVSVMLGDGQTLRWFRQTPSGVTDPVRSYTHTTSTSAQTSLGALASGVNLAGQGPAASVLRGTTVTLSMTAQYWMDTIGGCPGCITQGVIELEGRPVISCVNSITGWPGTTTPYTGSFTAPAAPGRYFLRVGTDWQFGCTGAVARIGADVVGVLDVY